MTCKDTIDLATVWMECGEDFEISSTYRALAGDSTLLGYLARDQRRHWEARTAAAILTVLGGPWRTRQGVLIGLLRKGNISPTGAQKLR